MATALELLTDSLRKLGVLSANETPRAFQANQALAVLNDLLEAWSTESLSVWGIVPQAFNTVVGKASYTIGPGGDWNTARPVRIGDPATCTYQGVDTPVYEIDQASYGLIPIKTLQAAIVQRYRYINDNPLGVITLYPVPAAVVPITLRIERVLTAIPTLQTVLVFPPGYKRALTAALAVELGPEYNIEASDTVKAVARNGKADLRRANVQRRVVNLSGVPSGNPWHGLGTGWELGQ